MRYACILMGILLLTGCGGRQLNQRNVVNLLAENLHDALKKDDIDVVSVQQISGSVAIVETKLNTTFRLEKTGDSWTVREIRLGEGRWENITDIERAIEMVKIEETNKMLDRIATAIQGFAEENGRMPDFIDYVTLSDQLSPRFLTPLIRLDPWRRPFFADKKDADTVIVRSAGADGRYGTETDIIRVVR
jgi:hypothetical protein